MIPTKCKHCYNSATHDGLCYSHFLAVNHKNETALEHRLNRPIRDWEIGKLEERWRNMPYAEKLREGDYLPDDSGMNVGDLEDE